jgi:3D (Asp-Asp-Asp) domain-containing protein
MRSWRRFLRRKQKPFLVLSLLSILNLIFPQHAQAATLQTSSYAAAKSAALIASVAKQTVHPRREILPTIPSVPARSSMRVSATAYTSSYDETDSDPWTTASGARAGDGVIAANGLAFGTRVRFPDAYGNKIFVVQDRMSSRYGKAHVDIWMPSKAVARQWGVRSVRMEIL